MSKQLIKQLIENRVSEDGLFEAGVKGVQLFRVTEAQQCAPAVYEPTVVAILNGTKEAILDGTRHKYDSSRYMCCPIPMPVEAGTPTASIDEPVLGVYISLDTMMMTELVLKTENVPVTERNPKGDSLPQGFAFSRWDDTFTDALLRLLHLGASEADSAVLGNSRLRELYYAILKGEAGDSARSAFGAGNKIARAIEYLSSHLNEPMSIEKVASQAGMSRAVFHRKFKQTTSMSPIQFVKTMRLNKAAMKITLGATVNEAAMDVGYVSSSQFSREFKRMYGQSPKQWKNFKQLPAGLLV